MGTMMVSLLFVLLGSKALAAPLEEDRDGEDEDESEDDMILSSVQKQMLAQFEIKNAKDQEEADNYNEDKKPAKGGPQTGAARALDRYHWKKGILYYDLSKLGVHVSWFLKSRIRSALQDLMDRTNNCVQFVEKTSGPRVEVHSHGGCDSAVGRQTDFWPGGRQKLLLGSGCRSKGHIQHEFMHALGFLHLQMRSDRDRYIEVKWKNIARSMSKKNFKKYDPTAISHYGLPFDYESIMLYGSYAGSFNAWSFIPKMFWKKTIVTKDPSKQDLIGNRKEASAGDIKMIKKAYEFTGNKGCKA